MQGLFCKSIEAYPNTWTVSPWEKSITRPHGREDDTAAGEIGLAGHAAWRLPAAGPPTTGTSEAPVMARWATGCGTGGASRQAHV